ncbi:hypothetical protein ACFL1B_06035 [Nanoarchaeota archaeon]
MKKAQIEMVGLIVIVIIAGLIMAFALVYMYQKADYQPTTVERYGESVVSKNFVSVLAQTEVPDCRMDFQSIVRDCTSTFNPDPALDLEDQGKPACFNQDTTCLYMVTVSNQILADTIEKWGMEYRLKIESPNDVVYETGSCTDNDEKESPGAYMIPLFPMPGQATIILEVCRT